MSSSGDSLFSLGQCHFWNSSKLCIFGGIYIRRGKRNQPSTSSKEGSSTELVTEIVLPSSPSTHFPLISPWVLINDGSFSPNYFAKTKSGSKIANPKRTGKRTDVAAVLAILKRTSWFCFATVLRDVRKKRAGPIGPVTSTCYFSRNLWLSGASGGSG